MTHRNKYMVAFLIGALAATLLTLIAIGVAQS